MSDVISQQRCSVYPDRPAVARCPECRNHFSRECVAEHEGRLICALCLEKLTRKKGAMAGRVRLPVVPVLQLAVSSVLVWIVYYALARLLILIPSEFHEGSIWSS